MEAIQEYLGNKSGIGIALLATDMTIFSWNTGAEDLTGYTFEAVQKVGLEALFIPVNVLQHLLRQSQDGGETPRTHCYLYRADDYVIPVTVKISSLSHPDHGTRQIEVAFCKRTTLQLSIGSDEPCRPLHRPASALTERLLPLRMRYSNSWHKYCHTCIPLAG